MELKYDYETFTFLKKLMDEEFLVEPSRQHTTYCKCPSN